MGASTDTARIDLDTNPWDQDTFMGELQMLAVTMITKQTITIPGRFRYFAWMSNPMNGLVGNQTLVEAKQLLEQYRAGTEPPGTTETQVTRDT